MESLAGQRKKPFEGLPEMNEEQMQLWEEYRPQAEAWMIGANIPGLQQNEKIDWAHEVLWSAATRWDKTKNSSFKTYLYRGIANVIKDAGTASAKRRRRDISFDTPIGGGDEDARTIADLFQDMGELSGEDPVAYDILKQRLKEILKDPRLMGIVDHLERGMLLKDVNPDFVEIGRLMGVSAQTIYSDIRRIRDLIIEHLPELAAPYTPKDKPKEPQPPPEEEEDDEEEESKPEAETTPTSSLKTKAAEKFAVGDKVTMSFSETPMSGKIIQELDNGVFYVVELEDGRTLEIAAEFLTKG